MAKKSYSLNNITISEHFIISTPDIIIKPTECLGWTFFQHLRRNENKIAQIDIKTDKKDTFGDLLQRSVRTALHLKDKNIKQKDIITLCTWNHLDSAVPYIATQFLGAKLASIDPSFSPPEMTHLLKQVQPRIIFAVPESVKAIEEILKNEKIISDIVVFGENDKHCSFQEFLLPHRDEDVFEPLKILDLGQTALIHFSSGTTGLPKGICLSHYAILGQMCNSKIPENVDNEFLEELKTKTPLFTNHLSYTSFYWLSASGLLIGSIMEGWCRLVCPYFDPKEIWDLIEKYKPISLTLTPVQIIETIAHRKSDVNLDSIFSIAIVGSSISKEQCLRVKENFPKAYVSRPYGQTEVTGPITLFKAHDVLSRFLMQDEKKIESIGLPIRGVTYRVVHLESGQNLGPNESGELRVKTKFIMNGYHNLDSSETFDEDGWLKTGDVVYYDDDLCFYYVDRIKEAFKYRGWFITPTLLENELFNHPAVKHAVVIGIPEEDGHHPMGLVVIKDGFAVTEEEIERFIENRVPERLKLRAGVKFIKTIPLTVTGKVDRRKIKDMWLKDKVKNSACF